MPSGRFSKRVSCCRWLRQIYGNRWMGLVGASDASEMGGGLCVSNQLTEEGHKVRVQLSSEEYRRTRCTPFHPAGAMPATTPTGPRLFVFSLCCCYHVWPKSFALPSGRLCCIRD